MIKNNWMTDNNIFGDNYSRNKTINSVISRFDIARNDSTEGQTVYLRETEKERVTIQFHYNPLNEKIEEIIICFRNEANSKRGDYVVWNNEHWLIFSKPRKVDGAYTRCLARFCNLNFEFMNDGQKVSSPCIYEANDSNSSDLYENKFITLADDEVLITLSNNEYSKTLEIDKRIMFNNDMTNIYKISRIQNLMHSGIVYIVMTKDQYDTTKDRADLNLCDYIKPIVPPIMDIDIIGSSEIKINQTLTYRVIDYPETLIFELRDDNGVDNTNMVEIIKVDFNTCKIKCNNDNINKYFRLYAIDNANNLSGYIRIQIQSLF